MFFLVPSVVNESEWISSTNLIQTSPYLQVVLTQLFDRIKELFTQEQIFPIGFPRKEIKTVPQQQAWCSPGEVGKL